MFITQYQIYEDLLLKVIQSVRILLRLLILQSAKFSTQVRILTVTAGGVYRIIYPIFALQIILIDRYSGAGTQKYLRYSKVPQ